MKNIVLLGFMGSGKTSTGKILAKKLKYNFIDVDKFIEKNAGKSINIIFKENGEKKFRKLEKDAVREASRMKKTVIATGGGVILSDENIKNLRKSGILITLMVSPGRVLKRIIKSNVRPLLKGRGKKAKIIKLMNSRFSKYIKCADYIIDTSDLTPFETSEKILCLKKMTSLRFTSAGRQDDNKGFWHSLF